jgi:hypothetical protein
MVGRRKEVRMVDGCRISGDSDCMPLSLQRAIKRVHSLMSGGHTPWEIARLVRGIHINEYRPWTVYLPWWVTHVHGRRRYVRASSQWRAAEMAGVGPAEVMRIAVEIDGARAVGPQ